MTLALYQNLVPQAKLAFIGYVLVLLSMIVAASYSWSSEKLVNILFYVIIGILGIYVTNCTVVGQCNLYAWVNGYLLLAVGIFTIIYLVFGYEEGSKMKIKK